MNLCTVMQMSLGKRPVLFAIRIGDCLANENRACGLCRLKYFLCFRLVYDFSSNFSKVSRACAGKKYWNWNGSVLLLISEGKNGTSGPSTSPQYRNEKLKENTNKATAYRTKELSSNLHSIVNMFKTRSTAITKHYNQNVSPMQ